VERGVISINVHANGETVESTFPLEQISDVIARDGELLWIDVLSPTPDELELLREEFGFHPLSIEDVARQLQRPKVDEYEGYVFLVFYAMARGDLGQAISLAQLSLFIGPNYVVTVHDRPLPVLEETRARWCRNVVEVGTHTVGLLVYSILDAIVDGYFPVLDEITDRLEDIEERIFASYDTASLAEVFQLKKELLHIRRVVAPARDVLNVLLRRDARFFDEATIVYFQDVYDHLLRVTDAVDTSRDLLSSALEFHLSTLSNRLNQVMKTLTASSIILMSMTLVASIYGMNFVHMPELGWTVGYPLALGTMATIGVVLFAVFRRIDWF
jgi:magnesium transporter